MCKVALYIVLRKVHSQTNSSQQVFIILNNKSNASLEGIYSLQLVASDQIRTMSAYNDGCQSYFA